MQNEFILHFLPTCQIYYLIFMRDKKVSETILQRPFVIYGLKSEAYLRHKKLIKGSK